VKSRIIAILLLGAMTGGAVRAGLPDAVLAHQVLSAFTESFIVRARVQGAEPARQERFATLFIFENLLWCYAAEIGTANLGPAPSGAKSPEAALAAFRQAFPDLESVVPYLKAQTPPTGQSQAALPNGCVIGCLTQLVKILVADDTPAEAGLVMFSYTAAEPRRGDQPVGLIDHCLLVYRTSRGWFCLDPARGDRSFALENIAVGTRLDPTLQVIANRPDYPLARARLLLIPPRTLDDMAARIAWNEHQLQNPPAPIWRPPTPR
jgi:hypothetical protein